jgi:hypothetical protein
LHGKLGNTWFAWSFGANILGAEHATPTAFKLGNTFGANDLSTELNELGATPFGAK